jgi:hypothetical protein
MTGAIRLDRYAASCAVLSVVDGFTVTSDRLATTLVTTAQPAAYERLH